MYADLGNRSYWYRIFSLRSEALWVFAGQLGLTLGVVLGVKILTQVLDPVEFGRLSIANTVVLLIPVSLFGPLGHGFMRFWSISHDRGQVKEFILTANRYAGCLLLFVLAASLAFFVFCSFTGLLDYQGLTAVSLIVGALKGYFGLRLAVLLGARKRKIVALTNAGTAILNPLGAAFLVIIFVSNADCAMWGYFITTLAILFVVEHCYKNFIKDDLNRSLSNRTNDINSDKMGKEILSFSWPFCVWGIFVWIHQSCDRWSLLAFHGADVVGAFSVVAVLAAYPLMFSSGFLLNLFMPVAYARAGDLGSSSALKSAYKFILVMIAVYTLGAMALIGFFIFFHEAIVLLISNAEYVKFSYLLPALTLSWTFFFLGETLAAFGFIVKKPKIYVLPKLISATIAAFGAFFLSSKIGAQGVVWALGISGFFYAAWCLIIAFRLFSGMSSVTKNPEKMEQALYFKY